MNIRKLKIAKRKSCLDFCEKTNAAYGKLHNYISEKNKKHNDLIFTRLDDSATFDSYNEVAQDLMREHFSVDTAPDDIYNSHLILYIARQILYIQ